MPTKEELEAANNLYWASYRRARELADAGDLPAAIAAAREGWPHITGMMQYCKKWLSPVTRLDAIELVLWSAPVVFDRESLDLMAALFKSQKAILKSDANNLPARLAEARDNLGRAHVMWDHLEKNPGFLQAELRQALGGDQDWWRWLAETWEQQGYVRRADDGRSYRLTLTTDFDEKSRTKCPACGAAGSARRWRLWEEVVCPGCKQTVTFVILSS